MGGLRDFVKHRTFFAGDSSYAASRAGRERPLALAWRAFFLNAASEHGGIKRVQLH